MNQRSSETDLRFTGWVILLAFLCLSMILAGCAFDKFRNELSIEHGSISRVPLQGPTVPISNP